MRESEPVEEITMNRHLWTASTVMICLWITACETPADGEFALSVPSAVVETREAPSEAELNAETKVVVLGTGTPIPDAHRAGPSIAVVHRGQAYLFDVGAGAIRNAATARYKYDIPSLYPTQICCVFITHLHSDHVLDLVEAAYTMWWRRPGPLQAFGPLGLEEIAEGMAAMMAPDTRIRTSGTQPVPNPDANTIEATEIDGGVVYETGDLRIEAFSVSHGDIKPAFGYRITAHDKTIVISGDTAIDEKLREMSRGVDILIHEVISDEGLSRNSEAFQAYHMSSHTRASDLGRLAAETRPGLLVLYHALYYGVPEDLILDEVRATYDGDVVLANDLDIF